MIDINLLPFEFFQYFFVHTPSNDQHGMLNGQRRRRRRYRLPLLRCVMGPWSTLRRCPRISTALFTPE